MDPSTSMLGLVHRNELGFFHRFVSQFFSDGTSSHGALNLRGKEGLLDKVSIAD